MPLSITLPSWLKRWLMPYYYRLRLMRSHSSALEIGRFGNLDVAYRSGTTDEDVIRQNFRDDFFAGVPEYLSSPQDTIIDVGAHIGTFSLLAASRVPHGRVFAIEACKESFNLLRVNVALNQAKAVDTSHLALSDQRGTCMLHYDLGNWGHTIIRPIVGQGETVPAESLQGFLASKNITRCHFMKLNCEGAEFRILLNTPHEVLRRFGIILTLYHCDICPEHSERDLLTHFQGAGFTASVRNQAGPRGWIVAVNPDFMR